MKELNQAAQRGMTREVKAILKANPEVDTTLAVVCAMRSGQVGTVKLLSKHNDMSDQRIGQTLLESAEHGDVKVVKVVAPQLPAGELCAVLIEAALLIPDSPSTKVIQKIVAKRTRAAEKARAKEAKAFEKAMAKEAKEAEKAGVTKDTPIPDPAV